MKFGFLLGKRGTKGRGGGVAFLPDQRRRFVILPQTQWTEWDWRKSLPSICSSEGDHNLLDCGATVMLLGSALTGPGLVRRYLR